MFHFIYKIYIENKNGVKVSKKKQKRSQEFKTRHCLVTTYKNKATGTTVFG